MPTRIEVFHQDNTVDKMDCVPLISIGRDKSNVVQLRDPMASRNHAVINCLSEDQYFLMDTGSRNGVYINSRRISAPTQLKNLDEITIGDSKIVFHHERTNTAGSGTVIQAREDFNETMHAMKTDLRSVIVLVSDIRGFTTLSESLPIETLTKVMTAWFQEIQSIIERNYGVVDKFLGDCVLAQWEVDRNDQGSVPLVLNTALEIAEFSATMQDRHPELPHNFSVGCGINAGTVSVGIGMENTILGDVVNTAFRLESSSKDLNKDIVMNDTFYTMHPDKNLRIEQDIMVKGKHQSLRVSALTYDEARLWVRMNQLSN